MEYRRQIKYYYLRFITLRGTPHALALGLALGIFSGLLPIMPFQIALALTLALFFKGSKITAALGTWISNPLNWYFLYLFSYKIGASILGLAEQNGGFLSVMEALQHTEETMAIVLSIAGLGGTMICALLLGGVAMGTLFAVPSYFIFLRFFQVVKTWRDARRKRKQWGHQSFENGR